MLAKSGKKIDQIVTYHDPCHAKNARCLEEPRELLKQNYVLTEMSDQIDVVDLVELLCKLKNMIFAKAAGSPKAAMIRDTKSTNCEMLNVVHVECKLQTLYI